MNQKTGSRLVFITLYLLLLSSCVTLNDPESSQEYRSHPIAEITPDQDFGQVFVSRRPKLNRLQVWLQIPQQASDLDFKVIASLFNQPTESEPLATVTLSKDELLKNFPVSIRFPTQSNLPEVSYYLRIETTGGKVVVYGRDEDQYSPGEAWINNQPKTFDAAFRAGYDYNLADFLNDIQTYPQTILLVICIFWICWMPGRLCLLVSGFDSRYDWGERTAISIGIGLAFYPIIFIWTSLFNTAWDRASVWGLLISITGLCLYLVIRRIRNNPIIQPQISKNWWISLGLLSIFLASLAVRLVMVRDISAPAWVDSVHHALLGKLIVLNGGIPDSYSPFVDIQTANYHIGFHVTLALFQWLSQLDISQALLIFGQVINALMVFSTYLLTTTLVKNQIAGLVAAFFTGLVTPMPAYYTSWGRFTQLAGLVMLPAAVAIVYSFLDGNNWQPLSFRLFLKKRENLANISLISILSVGLFLTHYRVFAFEVTLIFVISIFTFYSWLNKKNLNKTLLVFSIYSCLLRYCH